MMGEVPEDEAELRERWRQGERDDRALFALLCDPMRRRARQAISRTTGTRPNSDDVDEAVSKAFLELLNKDPTGINTLVGLGASIAYRRGQDVGRRLNREREFPADNTQVADATASNPEEEVLQAERAAEEEHVHRLVRECIEELPSGQAAVVRATILERQQLSDWAHENGKTPQAAGKQRTKALMALRTCVESRRTSSGAGGDRLA